MLDTTAWEQRIFLWKQRITLWKPRGVSLTRSAQEAERKELRAALPEYAALHRPVVQDLLARREKTDHAVFRRVQQGEKPGVPRFQGQDRYDAFTAKASGNGVRLENGSLVLAKIGRLAVRWSRPIRGIQGSITTVTICKEAGGW
jgi:putative transposase